MDSPLGLATTDSLFYCTNRDLVALRKDLFVLYEMCIVYFELLLIRITAHKLGIYTITKRLFLLFYTKRDVRTRNKINRSQKR